MALCDGFENLARNDLGKMMRALADGGSPEPFVGRLIRRDHLLSTINVGDQFGQDDCGFLICRDGATMECWDEVSIREGGRMIFLHKLVGTNLPIGDMGRVVGLRRHETRPVVKIECGREIFG